MWVPNITPSLHLENLRPTGESTSLIMNKTEWLFKGGKNNQTIPTESVAVKFLLNFQKVFPQQIHQTYTYFPFYIKN